MKSPTSLNVTVDGTSFAVLYVLPVISGCERHFVRAKEITVYAIMVKVMVVSYLSPIGLPRVLE